MKTTVRTHSINPVSNGRRILTAITAFLFAVAVFPFSAHGDNTLTFPQYTVDGLKIVAGTEALMQNAKAEKVVASEYGLSLAPDAVKGSIELQPIATDFPFNEAIPSWNGHAPEGTGFRVWMRVGSGSTATDYFEAGSWGKLADEITSRILVFPGGKYDVDTLVLEKPVEWAQFRIDLVRPSAKTDSPSIRQVALSYTNSTGDKSLWRKFGVKSPEVSREIARLKTSETLSIPFRNQVVPEKTWISRICSAASLSMVLGNFGVPLSTYDTARMIYDKPSDAFGVWNRSIQGGAQQGLTGYITRMRSFDQVRDATKSGNVVCASIRFRIEEVKSPPLPYRTKGTDGHLIVINGFAPGKIIVNNPGSTQYGPNQLWTQEDLAKAWFDKGGVAYVFSKPEKK